MEGALVIAVGLVSGALGMIVLDGRERVVVGGGGRVPTGMRALRMVRRASTSRFIQALLNYEPILVLAGRIAGSLPREMDLDVPSAAVLALCGAALASLAGGVAFGSPVASVAIAFGLAGLVAGRDASRRRRDHKELVSAMPGIYRTLSVALASGQTLSQAVDYVGAHERGPAAEAFARMSLRLRCGTPIEEAVVLLGKELDVPGSDLLPMALVISHRTGSPLRELLLRTAALAEGRGEFERTLGVKTAQVRLSVRIVCLLPVAMLGLLALLSPDFQAGLQTPVGMGCVLVAALLDALALLVIRRLMRGVL